MAFWGNKAQSAEVETGRAAAGDYISDFISKQKVRNEKHRQELEEHIRAARIVLQEKVQIDEQAPALWDELAAHITRKVEQINTANGDAILHIHTPSPEEFDLRSDAKLIKLVYNRATHVIQVNASYATKRKWKSLHAIVDAEKVTFAENTTQGFSPLTADEIMMGLLASFGG